MASPSSLFCCTPAMAQPKTMKAVYQTEAGSPDVLKVGDLPMPEPKGTEVLVKVHAVSLNPVDFKVSKTRTKPNNAPFICGWDAAGVVVGLGPDSKLLAIGDKVMFAGDLTKQGCHAQYCVVDERIVGRKPTTLSYLEAAALPLTSLTAWEGMLENMDIPKAKSSDKSILIVGAAGGVGSIACQIAKKVLGLKVIGTASRPETVEWAKKMGADTCISHRKDYKPQFEELKLKDADYCFNAAGRKSNFDQIHTVLKCLGKWVEINDPPKDNRDHTPLFYKRIQLSYELMYTRTMYDVDPIKQREILNAVAELVDLGVLETTMTEKMNLFKDIQAAYKKQLSGTMIGKICMVVDHPEGSASQE